MKTKTLILSLLLFATSVCAEPNKEWDGGYGIRAERRSDFTLGGDFGLGLGQVYGYPNNATKLNDPRYESDTGFAVGDIGKAWAGGYPRDWFGFALGMELLSLRGNGLTASGGAFILRTEVYPLWNLGGTFRDLGAYGDFGLGVLKNRANDKVRADGGSLAVVGFGVFHETLRLAHFTVGPTLGYSTYFSETMTGHLVQLGLRGTITSGP